MLAGYSFDFFSTCTDTAGGEIEGENWNMICTWWVSSSHRARESKLRTANSSRQTHPVSEECSDSHRYDKIKIFIIIMIIKMIIVKITVARSCIVADQAYKY